MGIDLPAKDENERFQAAHVLDTMKEQMGPPRSFTKPNGGLVKNEVWRQGLLSLLGEF